MLPPPSLAMAGQSLEALLAPVCMEIEAGLKPYLIFARGYLPQTFVLRSEKEVVSLHVDSRGNARTIRGPAPNPDVTIEWSHASLSAALRFRDSSAIPPGPPPQITIHTEKGGMAFAILRKRLGV